MQDHKTLSDWVLFGGLSTLWAVAYAFTRLAVSQGQPELGFPPQFIIPARLTIAALILLAVAAFSRQKWPPFSEWKSWLAMSVMGIVGTAFPFFVITTAQKTVDSSLAALYVAASPLFVAVMAHFFFSDDRITPRKALGVTVGFAGVAVLFGPEAIQAFGSASVAAQALCLLGTIFYAISNITARYAKDIPPFVFAAGFVTIGAITTWPLLFTVDFESLAPSNIAIAGVVGLAIGPTAMASIVYMILIKRTSATFLSLTGYTIPVISAVIGYLAFKEVQTWNALLAFAMILSGVWLAQRSNKLAATG
jgi:drug/metabolite transporter (DMT)-like permease